MLIIILIICVCVSCSTRAALKHELALEYYNLGNYYYKNNNISKAIELFKKAISFDEELIKANYNLTLVLIMENRSDEANEILLGQLKNEPENISLLQLLGYSYYMQGDYTAALQIFDRILSIQANDLNALYNKGIVLWRMQRTDEAVESFKALLEYSENVEIESLYADTLYALGEIMINKESWEDASEYLTRYLQIDVTDTENRIKAMFLLAQAYNELEQFNMVVETYESIIELDEENMNAWFGTAYVLLTEIEFPAKGLEALKSALEFGYNDSKKLKELVDNQDLVEPEAVEELLNEFSVYPAQIVPIEDDPAQQEENVVEE